MLFFVLSRKAYRRNLQYRSAHVVHNAASAIFGFVYAAIWIGIGENSDLGEYGVQGMVAYISFNQATLWIVMFLTNGLGIERRVRTGDIALDLLRPAHLFYQLAARECGQIAYQFVYKFVPIYLLYFFVFSLSLPQRPATYLYTAVSLGLAAWISVCINYMIGAAALWTTESRWLYWVNFALSSLLSGFFIPLEWLPAWLRRISEGSPYPFLQYVPARLYLEMESPRMLFGSLAWCVFMTLLCLLFTAVMRRKLEVQGG